MYTFLKKVTLATALVSVLVFGAWAAIDITEFSFDASAIIAEAGGGCGGCGGLPPELPPEYPIDGGGGGGEPHDPPECDLYANPQTLSGPGNTTLTWYATFVKNGNLKRLVPGGSPVVILSQLSPAYGGSVSVSVTQTTTFVATFNTTNNDVIDCVTTVVVGPPPPPPVCVLSASPTSINQGSSSTLAWTTTNGTSFSINQSVGSVTPVSSGTKSVTPSVTTTYTGTVVGAGGVATCSTTVTVIPPSAPTCVLSISPSSINQGGSATISWTSTNATSGTIDNGVGAATPVASGSKTVSPSTNTTYTGTFTGPGGTVTCSRTITVVPPNAPVCTLSANPTSIVTGGSSTLSWTTSNATTFSINQSIGSVTPVPAGTRVVSPTVTTTYTGTATGPGGTATCSTVVTVTPITYGPYCGDGMINQSWEQCDGGAQCTDKCTFGNQCVDLILARINVTDVKNSTTKPGNMTSDLFIGGSATQNKIPDNVWFALRHNGTYFNDAAITGYANVPGLAVERDQGKVRVQMYGSYSGGNADPNYNEHVEGYVELWQADIDSQVNDKSENPFNGVKQLLFSEDELWISSAKSFFWMSVNYDDDGSFTLYDNDVPNCAPTPACTLNANPTSINQGGSSSLTWTTTNGTSFSINQGVGPVTPVATGTRSVSPSVTTVYTGTVTGAGGTAQCSATVTVIPPNAPTCVLTATPSTINQGSSSLLSWVTTNATAISINQGIGPVTPVATGTRSVSPSVTTTYTATATGPGGSVQCSAPVTVTPVVNAPTCELTLTPSSVAYNGTATLAWTSANTTSGSINQGIGSVVLNGSTSVTGTTTTTYIGTFTGPGGTVTCNKTLTVAPPPSPMCTLSLSRSTIKTGESTVVSWTSANVTTGFITGGVGTTSPVSSGSFEIFPPDDTTFTGTFSGPLGTTTCSIAVDVTTTTGCQSNCGGGGFDQPNVVLFKKPGDQPLAFVYLSQIPYTGFEAGPVLTLVFWLAVILLAGISSYFVMGKGGVRYILGRTFMYAGIPVEEDVMNGRAKQEEKEEVLVESTLPVARQIPSPVITVPSTSGIPDLNDVIESRAHAAGVLMSPEAVLLAAGLSTDRAEALQKFGVILNEAVRTIPREDGWVMLSSDRFMDLAEKKNVAAPANVEYPDFTAEEVAPSVVYSEVAPAVQSASVDETAGVAFVSAILSGDRETAYGIIRSLERDGVNPSALMTSVATVVDRLFRVRKGGKNGIDHTLLEKAQNLSDGKLSSIVEVFAHALDQAYSSPFTAIKLALAQAFEVIG